MLSGKIHFDLARSERGEAMRASVVSVAKRSDPPHGWGGASEASVAERSGASERGKRVEAKPASVVSEFRASEPSEAIQAHTFEPTSGPRFQGRFEPTRWNSKLGRASSGWRRTPSSPGPCSDGRRRSSPRRPSARALATKASGSARGGKTRAHPRWNWRHPVQRNRPQSG